jgi:hypothetical protein
MGLGLMNTFETRYGILIYDVIDFLNALINDSIKLGVVLCPACSSTHQYGTFRLFYVSQDLLDTRGSRGK